MNKWLGRDRKGRGVFGLDAVGLGRDREQLQNKERNDFIGLIFFLSFSGILSKSFQLEPLNGTWACLEYKCW